MYIQADPGSRGKLQIHVIRFKSVRENVGLIATLQATIYACMWNDKLDVSKQELNMKRLTVIVMSIYNMHYRVYCSYV